MYSLTFWNGEETITTAHADWHAAHMAADKLMRLGVDRVTLDYPDSSYDSYRLAEPGSDILYSIISTPVDNEPEVAPNRAVEMVNRFASEDGGVILNLTDSDYAELTGRDAAQMYVGTTSLELFGATFTYTGSDYLN